MGEEKLLNRPEWLMANGYRDPFLPESLKAESDEDLKTCYLDSNDIEYLVGDFNKPGYRLIFSKSGGGKSGLIKRIHWDYEKIGKPKTLILDYAQHGYSLSEATVYDHISRILSLAENELKKNYGIKRTFRKDKSFIKKSPKAALTTLLNTCRELSFAGLYILIDNVVPELFDSLASLALFETKGIIIKFFLGENLLLMAQSISALRGLPKYIVRWSDDQYAKILNQRLANFSDSQIVSGTLAPGISSLCESHISESVHEFFIKIGKLGCGPAVMWEFGDFLLNHHIGMGQKNTDLIDQNAFQKAQLQFFHSMLESNTALGSYLDDNLNTSVRKASNVKPRATVFIHYCEEDRETVTHTLYQALVLENFYPWMECFDILPGQTRKLVISQAIKMADFIIPCISTQSLSSRGEYQTYLKQSVIRLSEFPDHSIFMIPFRLDDCKLPDEINHLQHVDRFDTEYVERLYQSLKQELANRKARKV